jgi:hypothetical protein
MPDAVRRPEGASTETPQHATPPAPERCGLACEAGERGGTPKTLFKRKPYFLKIKKL